MRTYENWNGGAINLASSWNAPDPTTAPGPDDTLVLTGGGTIQGGEGGFGEFVASAGSYTLVGTLKAQFVSFVAQFIMSQATINDTSDLYFSTGPLALSGATIRIGGDFFLGYFSSSNTVTANIAAGSLLQASTLTIGYDSPATLNLNASTITITGKVRKGLDSIIYVGTYASTGRLNVTNGSHVTAPAMEIDTGSKATFGGAGTTVALAGDEGLSQDSGSSLAITSGASVSTTSLQMGEDAGSTAPKMVVSGSGTTFQVTTGYADVANGDIQVGGGASFQGGQNVALASSPGYTASIEVTGGARFSAQALQMGVPYGASAASISVIGANSQVQVGSQLFLGTVGASITVASGGAFLVGTDARVVKNAVSIGKSGTIASYADNSLACGLNVDGTFMVAQGAFTENGLVSGFGTIAIGASATFAMSNFASAKNAPTIDFSGSNGTLDLTGTYAAQALKIEDFAYGDKIVFGSMTGLTTFAVQNKMGAATGEVDVYSGKTQLARLYFAPSDALDIEPVTTGGGTVIQVDDTNVLAAAPQIQGSNVTWSFVDAREGNALAPYILEKDHSGVTVGIGCDLPNGPITQSVLRKLFGANSTADENLAILFDADSENFRSIYASKTTTNQEKLDVGTTYLDGACVTKTIEGTYDTDRSISSSITTSQGNAISNEAKRLELTIAVDKWNHATPAVAFGKLPPQAQTVLLDLVYNRGSIPGTVMTAMVAAAKNITTTHPTGLASDWTRVYNAVNTYATKDPSRRMAEAQLIAEIKGASPAKPTPAAEPMNVASAASDSHALSRTLFEGAFGHGASAQDARWGAAAPSAVHEALAISPYAKA